MPLLYGRKEIFDMKNLLLIISAFLIFVACATADKTQSDAKKQKMAEMVDSVVSSRNFNITVRTAYPMGGRSIHLTNNFSIRINGDSIISCLPYFGRGYNIPYGGGKGLNFSGIMSDFKMSQPKNDKISIELMVKNEEDAYMFYIDVFDNASALINVVPQQREKISFQGEVELRQ